MKPVCFFGAYDPAYPRNRILREGLRQAGVEVLEARVRERRVLFRYPALALAFARRARRAGCVLVPEFRHKDMPLARWLAGGRRLVFDPLVSRHDTLVGDWGLHAPDSFQARWNLAIDRAALGRADLVLCDTWAHGALFETLGVPRARLVPLRRVRRRPGGSRGRIRIAADFDAPLPPELLDAFSGKKRRSCSSTRTSSCGGGQTTPVSSGTPERRLRPPTWCGSARPTRTSGGSNSRSSRWIPRTTIWISPTRALRSCPAPAALPSR